MEAWDHKAAQRLDLALPKWHELELQRKKRKKGIIFTSRKKDEIDAFFNVNVSFFAAAILPNCSHCAGEKLYFASFAASSNYGFSQEKKINQL